MIKLKHSKKDTKSFLKKALKKFNENTKNPEIFLSIQQENSENIKNLLKSLYDFSKTLENDGKTNATESLPELIIESLDEEQIWNQLELQNSELFNENLTKTSNLLSFDEKKYQLNYNLPENGAVSASESDEKSSDQEMPSENESDKEEIIEKKSKKSRQSKNSSVLDDQFFKLDEMNKFLDDEDKREMRKTSGKPDNSLIEIDYFNDNISELDDDGSDDEINYSNFFDDEEDENSQPDNESSENEESSKRKVKFDLSSNKEKYLSDDNDFEENENDYKNNDNESDTEKPKSSFELRQEKLQKQIDRLEDRAMKEKSWQLKGEVTADSRPQNSLLEEILDFESTTRPAPVITEETTMKLEDIIRQRIKDKSWDDVERKIKPVDNPQEYRKQLVLDSEKSKLSLAELYEKDYLNKVAKPNEDDPVEEEPKEHKEIRKLMKSLIAKLDALSNYHFTPKPAIPELKIITNTPAINMEEVAPISFSNAAMLAPEEVKRKLKGDVLGKDERTKTDKNRERRKKKRLQKAKHKREEQQLLEREAKGIKNNSLDVKKKLLDKVTKNTNVNLMNDTGSTKALKTSKAFFTQLQDEVSTQIKSKSKAETTNRNKKAFTATHLKL
uniref:U3 small nucleolar ribonucleoprotein protein MPP10 n=1 Tax=Corethrella appendiculata TaxID=1370023 RepID=U5EMS2_9DIPT